ncbi:SpoIIE family protein phosphatase, partial [Arthrobacter deserti]|nr:SpoIIE family protein phosphatase [Arthrobacter deserti]
PSGLPLGVLPGQTWQVHTTTLEPGETLVVASDGLLDFFPSLEETLDQALQANLPGRTAAELVDGAVSFARAQGHPDDVTVLALRRTAAGAGSEKAPAGAVPGGNRQDSPAGGA